MKFGAVSIEEAEGGILAHAAFSRDAKLAKGTRLGPSEIAMLKDAGVTEVFIARLDRDDVAEDVAAQSIGLYLAGPGAKVDRPGTGRCNIFATANGVFTVGKNAIDALNAIDEAITIATLPAMKAVHAGEMIATIKIIPFAVTKDALSAVWERAQPGALSVSAFRPKAVAVVSTLLPRLKSSVVQKSVANLRTRLQPSGGKIMRDDRVPHDIASVAASLRGCSTDGADLIVIFGASATADRHDVVPAAIVAAGGMVEHFGMPVDPGNLLLLGRLDGRPVVGAPGCARSPKENGFDWVLQRLMAEIPTSGADIRQMGVGGLLVEMPSRPHPRVAGSPTPAVAAVILAAGRGSRMGGEKMTAQLAGKPLLLHAVDAALASRADPVIVVTGHRAEQTRALLVDRDVVCVHNADYLSGMAGSLRTGLGAVPEDRAGALILPGDMPLVDSFLMDALATEAALHPLASAIVPTHAGKRGNPALLMRRLFSSAMSLAGDVGARSLLESGDVVEMSTDNGGILLDIDTMQDLADLAVVRDVESPPEV